MNILFVLTSHNQLGDTNESTGFWMEEFTTPYYFLKDAGAKITLASPKGGQPPIDPKSQLDDSQTDSTRRLEKDADLLSQLENTTKLSEVSSEHFDAVFYPGGHGPLWDLTNNVESIRLIEAFYNANKLIAMVCHAPAVLLNTKTTKGTPILQNKKVTGFSNSEEIAVNLHHVVPFLLEDELKSKGAKYLKEEDWASFAIKDGLVVTGQNPASSIAVAEIILKELNS